MRAPLAATDGGGGSPGAALLPVGDVLPPLVLANHDEVPALGHPGVREQLCEGCGARRYRQQAPQQEMAKPEEETGPLGEEMAKPEEETRPLGEASPDPLDTGGVARPSESPFRISRDATEWWALHI